MKQITTSVGFQDAKGTAVANGSLSLTLSQNAEITATGGQVTTEPLYFPLDATGKISPTNILFSDELTPSGTVYKAILYASNGMRIIQDFGYWSITGASADLSTMIPTSIGGASAAGVVLLAPSGTQTVVQPSGTSLNVNRFENIRYADQFSGADMAAKIAAAIADLPSTGGIVDARAFQGAQAWSTNPFVSATVPVSLLLGHATITASATISIPSYCSIYGVGIGSTTANGTRIVASSGSVTPIVQVSGASAGTRIVKVALRDMTIQGVYTAAQIGLKCDHVTDVELSKVQFATCGQAEWLNDYYRVTHYNCSYNQSGSGGANTTATVRLENTSNPGVPSEQGYFHECLWEGDNSNVQQGTALYVGPAVSQTNLTDSKLDYGSTIATFNIIQCFQTSIFTMHDCWLSNVTGTGAGTGLTSVLVTGTGGTPSSQIDIHNNLISMPNAGIGITVDFCSAVKIEGNVSTSNAGTGTVVNITANAINTVVGPCVSLNADTPLANASATTKFLVPVSNSVSVWNLGTVAGRFTVAGASGSFTTVFQNNTDAQANFGFSGGATVDQDTFLNFQDQAQTTKASISRASAGHGGRISVTNNGNTGLQLDTSGNVIINIQESINTTNGGSWIKAQASELLTLSTVGTTTDTTANLLPANSIIEAVVARVTTTITTATDWKLGDATQAGRFSAANATMTAGATSIGLNQADPTVASANLGPVQTSAAKVRVTTTGTPGAGIIRITVFYRQFVAPTS